MAVTAGTAWNGQTVATATNSQLLPSGRSCEEFVISCASASAASLRINVRNKSTNQSTHPAYDAASAITYFLLAAGESITFAGSIDNPITSIIVDGNGGTATFSGTITKP